MQKLILACFFTCLAQSGAGSRYKITPTVHKPLSHAHGIFRKAKELLSNSCRVRAVWSGASTHFLFAFAKCVTYHLGTTTMTRSGLLAEDLAGVLLKILHASEKDTAVILANVLKHLTVGFFNALSIK